MKKFPGSQYLFLLGKIGSMVMGSILFFFFVGLFLDRWLGWGGLGMIVGTFIGLMGGFYLTYKSVMTLPNLDLPEDGEQTDTFTNKEDDTDVQKS